MLKKFVNAILSFFAAIYLLLEELLWRAMARAMQQLARLRVVAKLEKSIQNLPPYVSLILFFVPIVALLPAKIFALYLITQGHALLGVGFILLLKIISTALLARLYVLTHPKLMSIAWFARAHNAVMAFKTRVFAKLESYAWWRSARALMQNFRQKIKIQAHVVKIALARIFSKS